MAKEFPDVRPEVLAGTAQSLLELKKMARSIEQSVDALMPLADADTQSEFQVIAGLSQQVAAKVSAIYHRIAKEAMSNG